MYLKYVMNNTDSKCGHNTCKNLAICYIALFLAFTKAHVFQNLNIKKIKKNIYLNSLLSLINSICSSEDCKNEGILYTIKRLYFIIIMQLTIFRAKYYQISINKQKIDHNNHHQFLINHRRVYISFTNVVLVLKTFIMFTFLFYLKIYKFSTNSLNAYLKNNSLFIS
mmetsp:Transcript_5485/g.7297  ORF Transcript_5485/g.7297 Transcript_5485/m.7297 type:complete len:167 (-) Transcript_5485:2722-3222(-)